MRRAVLMLAVGGILTSYAASPGLIAQDSFPHERHALFFSDCQVCHAGVVDEAVPSPYPDPSFCAACHDGTTAPAIEWKPPDGRISNLAFDHTPHDFGCDFCHLPGGEEDLAAMKFPGPATCIGCHAPEAQEHLAADECDFCHLPVVKTRLDQDRILDFPTPPSHQVRDFSVTHGSLAADRATNCATCHDQTSCTTCHGGATHVPDPVLALSRPEAGGPKGVSIVLEGWAGFHPPDFDLSHSALASSGGENCTICHSENTCAECHDGLGSPSFHPLDFMASHGPEAFGRVSDCKSCHNAEGFCRECHIGSGIEGGEGLIAPFHDGQTLWILSHPQAARQDLESCVSCHQQKDCLRCHSATSGLRMNPHGPDFDASSMRSRNKAMCELCHLPGVLGGAD